MVFVELTPFIAFSGDVIQGGSGLRKLRWPDAQADQDAGTTDEGHRKWISSISTSWSKVCAK
jgi:hypothetical protein